MIEKKKSLDGKIIVVQLRHGYGSEWGKMDWIQKLRNQCSYSLMANLITFRIDQVDSQVSQNVLSPYRSLSQYPKKMIYRRTWELLNNRVATLSIFFTCNTHFFYALHLVFNERFSSVFFSLLDNQRTLPIYDHLTRC